MQIQWRQRDDHIVDLVVRPISGRPLESTGGVVGFLERSIIRDQRKWIAAKMDNKATAIPMVGGS